MPQSPLEKGRNWLLRAAAVHHWDNHVRRGAVLFERKDGFVKPMDKRLIEHQAKRCGNWLRLAGCKRKRCREFFQPL